MKFINRHLYFLDFALLSLWRRKWKTVCLMMVYCIIVFGLASALFFSTALRREAKLILSQSPDMIVQRVIAGRHALTPAQYAEKIKNIRGIEKVQARLWGYYYNTVSGGNYTLMVPKNFPYKDNEIQVGEGVMRTWEAVSKNQLYFTAYDRQGILLDVIKKFGRDTGLISSDLILMSEKTFRNISGVPQGFVTDISIKIPNLQESLTIARKIIHALPDCRAILKQDILKAYDGLFDWRTSYVVIFMGSAVMAFFIFAWDHAFGTQSEHAEIGLLKALGWDISDILAMKFWQGAIISLSAFLLGGIGAYLYVFFTDADIFSHALKGWAVLYPKFRLAPYVSVYDLAGLLGLTVMPYTLMGLFPAWQSACMDSDTLMRQT